MHRNDPCVDSYMDLLYMRLMFSISQHSNCHCQKFPIKYEKMNMCWIGGASITSIIFIQECSNRQDLVFFCRGPEIQYKHMKHKFIIMATDDMKRMAVNM